jgi:hypothetical protein
LLCHPEGAAFWRPKDLGEPRIASRFLRRNNRAFGSLPLVNFRQLRQHRASLRLDVLALILTG